MSTLLGFLVAILLTGTMWAVWLLRTVIPDVAMSAARRFRRRFGEYDPF